MHRSRLGLAVLATAGAMTAVLLLSSNAAAQTGTPTASATAMATATATVTPTPTRDPANMQPTRILIPTSVYAVPGTVTASLPLGTQPCGTALVTGTSTVTLEVSRECAIAGGTITLRNAAGQIVARVENPHTGGTVTATAFSIPSSPTAVVGLSPAAAAALAAATPPPGVAAPAPAKTGSAGLEAGGVAMPAAAVALLGLLAAGALAAGRRAALTAPAQPRPRP